MFESFLVAFNAVAPFLILLGIGFLSVRLGLTDRIFMDRLNTLNFKAFFPFLMFNNIYGAKPENLPSLKLIATGALSVILLVILLVIVVPKIVKENPRRGVVIQGIFRSNFVHGSDPCRRIDIQNRRRVHAQIHGMQEYRIPAHAHNYIGIR